MSTASPPATATPRAQFSTRTVFVFAAIGSAVGLGNIWRFPFVAHDSGGGAFLLPYFIALLTAGIPILFFDYAIGHRFRGSAPLSFRRMHRGAEPIGWFQVGIAIVISIYYAVIIAWAAAYVFFSFSEAWGSGIEESTEYFTATFLQLDDPGFGLSMVPGIAIVLAVIWVITLIALSTGVQKGIGLVNLAFVPVLVVLFAIMVIRTLFLPGAINGLNEFFTPDWSALTDASVWIAAYGQIFFSLSIAFGIMITYSSYLKRKTDLTGSGLVVGFSNSSFEVLAGIGVFAAIGFFVAAAGGAWDDVDGGIGLVFFVFPALISEMPFSEIWGVVFFICVFLGGLTSFISITEVVVSSIQDKLAMSRMGAVLTVGVPMAVVSVLLMATTTGLYTLDTLDKFVNSFGIVGIAIVMLVVVGLILRKLGDLRDHLNSVSSFKVGVTWMVFAAIVTPLVLAVTFVQEIRGVLADGYEDYPDAVIGVWGWGMLGVLLLFAIVMSLIPWKKGTHVDGPPDDETPADHAPAGQTPADQTKEK